MKSRKPMESLAAEVHACRRCPRLVEWREASAADPPRRFRGEDYWAQAAGRLRRPRGAGWRSSAWRPAAHGGNRTGRIFTGDRSGDWLFAALHRAGYANQPRVGAPRRRAAPARRLRHRGRAAARRPPTGRPPAERDNCLPYLERELRAAGERCGSIVALGSFAWDGALRAVRRGWAARRRARSRASATAPRRRCGPLDRCSAATTRASRTPSPAAHRADAGRGVRAGPGAGG